MKQNIVFQQDWADFILTWDKDIAYAFMIAILEYGFYQNDGWTFDNPAVQRIYDEAVKRIDENRAKYEAKYDSMMKAREIGQKSEKKSNQKTVQISGQKTEKKTEQETEQKSTSIDKDIDIDISSNEDNIYIVGKPDFMSEIKQIVDYLNQKTQSNFKANTEATKKSIIARLKEGYTVEDFKRVIDAKVKDWADNPEMREYLRPQTLFRPSNFESYLNEANRPQVKSKNAFKNFKQNTYSADEYEKLFNN